MPDPDIPFSVFRVCPAIRRNGTKCLLYGNLKHANKYFHPIHEEHWYKGVYFGVFCQYSGFIGELFIECENIDNYFINEDFLEKLNIAVNIYENVIIIRNNQKTQIQFDDADVYITFKKK